LDARALPLDTQTKKALNAVVLNVMCVMDRKLQVNEVQSDAVELNVMCHMDRKLQVNEVQSDAVVLNVTINILFSCSCSSSFHSRLFICLFKLPAKPILMQHNLGSKQTKLPVMHVISS
jgi:hypothetical protein